MPEPSPTSWGPVLPGEDVPRPMAMMRVELRTAAAVVTGLLAGWLAAGAAGLFAHPLRHALVWLCGGAALGLGWPRAGGSRHRLVLVGAAILWVTLSRSTLAALDVAGIALLLAGLAWCQDGSRRMAFEVTTSAVACLALFQFACSAFPFAWWAANGVGMYLGFAAGAFSGRALNVGATFGGVDCLVTMAAFLIAWLARTPGSRMRRGLAAGGAVVGAHLLYLVALSWAADLLYALPEAPPPASRSFAANREVRPAIEWWTDVARLALPWNVPMLAAILHAGVAAGLLRWGTWNEPARSVEVIPRGLRLGSVRAVGMAGCGLALVVAAAGTFWPGRLNLEGKRIVVNERGFLNWLRPEHGTYGSHASGMYGLLADHLALYGATMRRSADLSETDLAGADILMLIFPNEVWQPGQLERIEQFVERGGTLLVLGEHTTRDPDGSNRFNEVLRRTAMQVAFDSATFAVGGWLHSYAPRLHPATMGISDSKNAFGVVIGASVDAAWPAQPLLCGKWGWNDPGDEGERDVRALLGNDRYDAGERLGDVVLAAEQRWGRGRVVVFGDTSGFVNGIAVNSHEFLSRLFGYLAAGRGLAQGNWRQALGGTALVALVLLFLGVWPFAPELTAWVLMVFVLSVSGFSAWTRAAGRLVPDGRRLTPNNLAYVDSTHLGRYSEEGWRDEGIAGLQLTLMRDGYLTFSLPEFSRDRLERAGLLVSIAPSRTFTPRERRLVREFVEAGGIFLITAGYEERRAGEALLADFGFRLADPRAGYSAGAEPQPMGYFKVPYLDAGEYKCFVRYHAAWPVAASDTNVHVVAYGHNNVPVILFRRVGKGKFVVIGDSSFALNKNLENQEGQLIEGLRENAVFWRWFLGVLRDQPMWVPPREAAVPQARTGANRAGGP